jgi:hypothetical protein
MQFKQTFKKKAVLLQAESCYNVEYCTARIMEISIKRKILCPANNNQIIEQILIKLSLAVYLSELYNLTIKYKSMTIETICTIVNIRINEYHCT